MKDYLIVGLGLSGAALTFKMEKMGKSFLVFDDESQKASKVAGGIMNPVVLKRFTLAWKADEQLDKAYSFYTDAERFLKKPFLAPLEIYRRFSSVEEQNDWFAATDRPGLSPFLDPNLISEVNPHIPGEFSFGKLRKTAKIDTRAFLGSYADHLEEKGRLKRETFAYQNLKITEAGVEYRGLAFKKAIFCEGFGLLKNPYFNYLPLRGNKGEYIFIKAPGLDLEVGVKSSVFIIPAGDDLYVVGATYSNSDKSPNPTVKAREELVAKLKNFVKADFEVVDQVAGLRPSTIDRRPLAGQHPVHKDLYCCNGFGSRGVLLAPTISEGLLNNIEHGESMDPEMDIARFTHKWFIKD